MRLSRRRLGTAVVVALVVLTALLYIDLRMRREGLDVELMRATGS